VASLRNLGYKLSSLLSTNPDKEEELREKLNFSSFDLQRLKYGRLSLTPMQISTAANTLSVKVEDLVNYKNSDSYKNMVHCMSNFSTQEHCDEILDLIDTYIDVKEAAVAEKIVQ
jgi:DNA-binding Xre family transcriptional regulator